MYITHITNQSRPLRPPPIDCCACPRVVDEWICGGCGAVPSPGTTCTESAPTPTPPNPAKVRHRTRARASAPYRGMLTREHARRHRVATGTAATRTVRAQSRGAARSPAPRRAPSAARPPPRTPRAAHTAPSPPPSPTVPRRPRRLAPRERRRSSRRRRDGRRCSAPRLRASPPPHMPRGQR